MRVNETSGELNFSYKYKCQWNGFVVQWISMTDYNRIFLMRPGNPYWLIVPWGRIYVSVNWVIIGSGNGFSLVTWTNAASRQQVSVKFKSEFYHFHSINSFENIVCQNGGHFVKGGGGGMSSSTSIFLFNRPSWFPLIFHWSHHTGFSQDTWREDLNSRSHSNSKQAALGA